MTAEGYVRRQRHKIDIVLPLDVLLHEVRAMTQ
jgi:hypothetical protein